MEQEVDLGLDEFDLPEAADGTDSRGQLLAEMADIDGHATFVEGMLRQSSLPAEQAHEIEKDLARVRARQEDPQLSFAVIGEFSSGKSSFINALLREELFETDAVQGSTVASTIIRYAPEPCLCLHRTDDLSRGQRVDVPPDKEELAETVYHYTSEAHENDEVRYVSLGYPSDFLRQGIRIIDTPGTNSLESWHEDVTRRTIRERADACIVITSATAALPTSLRSFLRANLEDVLSSCVFVVTSIDLVRPRDRERVLTYTKKVLSSELGVKKPLVLPYCSLLAGAAAEEFAESNRATEAAIVSFVRERRTQLQLQRCMALLGSTLDALGADMARVSGERAREHERLVAATTVDLDGFVSEQKTRLRRELDETVQEERGELSATLADVEATTRQCVRSALDSFVTEGQIRAYLNNGLSATIRRSKQSVFERIGMDGNAMPEAGRNVRDATQAARRRFEWAFGKQYRQLAVLAEELSMPFTLSLKLGSHMNLNMRAADELSKLIVANDTADTKRFMGGVAGGAAAGAAIGSVVPGLGTAVGAGVGAVAGLFGWSANSDSPQRGEAFRQQVRPSVDAMVRQCLDSMSLAVLQGFDAFSASCWTSLECLLDDYLSHYKSVVAAMRKRDEEEQARVATELARIQENEKLVRERVAVVRTTQARMTELEGGE